MFTSPSAIAISTPFCTIYWYGIVLAFAFAVGQFVTIKIAQNNYNEPKITEELYELALITIIAGVICARLYYVFLSFGFYAQNPTEIIMLNHGGMSIHGGLAGGILGIIFYCKRKCLNFFKYADLYALGLPVAQAIGRWGNFFNSEAFGLPANLPWAVYIPVANRPLRYLGYEYFHPTFLYESLLDIIIFFILFFIIKRFYFKKQGILFFSYLIFYSVVRIFVECIRIDSVMNIFGVPVAIWISFIIILIATIGIVVLTGLYDIQKD